MRLFSITCTSILRSPQGLDGSILMICPNTLLSFSLSSSLKKEIGRLVLDSSGVPLNETITFAFLDLHMAVTLNRIAPVFTLSTQFTTLINGSSSYDYSLVVEFSKVSSPMAATLGSSTSTST